MVLCLCKNATEIVSDDSNIIFEPVYLSYCHTDYHWEWTFNVSTNNSFLLGILLSFHNSLLLIAQPGAVQCHLLSALQRLGVWGTQKAKEPFAKHEHQHPTHPCLTCGRLFKSRTGLSGQMRTHGPRLHLLLITLKLMVIFEHTTDDHHHHQTGLRTEPYWKSVAWYATQV